MTRALFAALVSALAVVATGSAQDTKKGFVTKEFTDPDGAKVPYVVFVPHDYDGTKEYPVILFLHGAGETKGRGGEPVKVGIGPAIKKREKTFEFITVIPQSQKGGWGAATAEGKRAISILDEVAKSYKTDAKRVYLGRHRPRLRRRQRQGRREDQGHPDVGLPRRQGHGGEGRAVAEDGRSAEGGRRQPEVHRVPGRRAQQLGRGLRREGVLPLAGGAKAEVRPRKAHPLNRVGFVR